MTPKEEYALFLQSDFWRQTRVKVFKQKGRRCSRCGKTYSLQVHHLIYRRPYESVQLDDLIVLCVQCHEKEHGIENNANLSDRALRFKVAGLPKEPKIKNPNRRKKKRKKKKKNWGKYKEREWSNNFHIIEVNSTKKENPSSVCLNTNDGISLPQNILSNDSTIDNALLQFSISFKSLLQEALGGGKTELDPMKVSPYSFMIKVRGKRVAIDYINSDSDRLNKNIHLYYQNNINLILLNLRERPLEYLRGRFKDYNLCKITGKIDYRFDNILQSYFNKKAAANHTLK